MSARERILARVRDAMARRDIVEHPGAFGGWRPEPPAADVVEGFAGMFRQAGGEVVRVASTAGARRWLDDFLLEFEGLAVGATVPPELVPDTLPVQPEEAPIGLSMARGAVAETGSLILDARDGRRTQLLPPIHVVLVRAQDAHSTLSSALESLADELPSALGLHSGPSKSADIGQILVKGVHGPGRVIALVMEE